PKASEYHTMIRLSRALRVLLPLAAVAMTACNLSLSGKPATPTVQIIATNTLSQFPTQTPRPATNTPSPTNTSLPQPTSNVPPPYTVRQLVPGPICSVSPNVAVANIRSGPGVNFPVLGVLPANNWVLASRIEPGGWYQVSYAGTVVHGGWISNTVVNLAQPCSCGPNNCSQVSTIQPPTITPIPTNTPSPDVCSIWPLTPSDNVSIYYQPSVDAAVWDNLQNVKGIRVSYRTADGWYAVGPLNLQGPNIGINTLRWIRSDARITLTGAPCGVLKTIDISYPPPSGCSVSPMNISSLSIYPQHSFDLPASGTLPSGSSALAIGQTPPNTYGAPNGWYAIDPGIAQAGNVGKYRLRWIPIDNTVQLNGDCGINGLPTVTLDP
ncbi:MAG: SH3 domain-containing protein, partial [Anaerolineae bacterium]|nr:SH3 domain-containing protein [Anaerolineae bacterium]